MPKINFVKEKKVVEVPEGANLRREALKAGVEVYSGIDKYIHCPGLGICATCRVCIRKGEENVSRQGWWEFFNMLKHPLTFFARLGREKQLRLACQTKVYGDVEVETQPEVNLYGERFWG